MPFVDIFFGFVNEAYKRSGVKFDEDEKTKLLSESHNRGDWLLYQHFNRTLWMKIAQQPDFYEEVRLVDSLFIGWLSELVKQHSEYKFGHLRAYLGMSRSFQIPDKAHIKCL